MLLPLVLLILIIYEIVIQKIFGTYTYVFWNLTGIIQLPIYNDRKFLKYSLKAFRKVVVLLLWIILKC